MRKLLFFHATWCRPCRFYEKEFITPLEEMVGEGKIKRVDVQQDPFMADKYMISRLPAIVLLDNGIVKMNRNGAIDIIEIAEFLKNDI